MKKTNAIAVSRALRAKGFLPAPPTRPGLHVKNSGNGAFVSVAFFESVEPTNEERRLAAEAKGTLIDLGYVVSPATDTTFSVEGKIG